MAGTKRSERHDCVARRDVGSAGFFPHRRSRTSATTGQDPPAKEIYLSKSLFPPEPDDYYAEHGNNAKADRRIDFADVKDATLRSLGFIIQRLLPDGKQVGDEWVVRNPTRNDSKPGSFSVNMRTGVWADFATGASGGDMIDLYVYLNGGSNIHAKNALADILNVQARSGSKSKTERKSQSKQSDTAGL